MTKIYGRFTIYKTPQAFYVGKTKLKDGDSVEIPIKILKKIIQDAKDGEI